MNWNLAASFAIATLAIVNPLGKIPIWSELTGDQTDAVRRRIALMAVSTAVVIAVVFLLVGHHILQFFGIDLASFRIAGGVLLLLTGIEMLRGTATRLDDREDDGDSVTAVAKVRFRKIMVPVAIPVLAGPGTITTVVIYGIKAGGPTEMTLLAGVLVAVYLINLMILFAAPSVEHRVDPLVFEVFTRLFGLIIAALAVQFIVEGLGEVFPALLGQGSVIQQEVQEAERAAGGGS